MLVWLTIGFYLFSLLVIFLFALLQLSLAVRYVRTKKRNGATSLSELTNYPFVTIQFPVFNEKYVAERLLNKAVQMQWPKDKIEFQVLDDSTDETTEILNKTAETLKLQGFDISLVRRQDRDGFKAGALKQGLETAKGEFIAVFDADFLPDPDFLNRTIPFFNDERVGVVQTRWEHINRHFSLLTNLQAFALDAHFSVEQVGRNKGGHFINFNGTGGTWRRKTIEDAGGWQADTLTEDLDLSYRAQLKGWKFIYREDIGSPAELPVAISALKSQQYRWTKGGAETFKKMAWQLFTKKGLRFSDRLHGLAHLFNSSVFVFVFILALCSVPLVYFVAGDAVLSKWVDYSAAFFVSTVLLGFYYGVSYREQHASRALTAVFFVIRFIQFLVITMGLSWNNTRAVLMGYLGKKTAFVRTPKFNVEQTSSGSWKMNAYLNSRFKAANIVEFLLAIFFFSGIVVGIRSEIYGMIPFHTLLTIGFLSVFSLSIAEQKRDQ